MKSKKIYNFNFLEILDHRLPKLSFCYCKTPRRMKDKVRNLMLDGIQTAKCPKLI